MQACSFNKAFALSSAAGPAGSVHQQGCMSAMLSKQRASNEPRFNEQDCGGESAFTKHSILAHQQGCMIPVPCKGWAPNAPRSNKTVLCRRMSLLRAKRPQSVCRGGENERPWSSWQRCRRMRKRQQRRLPPLPEGREQGLHVHGAKLQLKQRTSRHRQVWPSFGKKHGAEGSISGTRHFWTMWTIFIKAATCL